ncbi:MAG: hypothetical protein Ct9H300mP16_16970 [Pseudomonadota bacterium]|nr:MAG: hypothetical protein Ct9H300mP16_16970 [Pseudomonadota bacterium]
MKNACGILNGLSPVGVPDSKVAGNWDTIPRRFRQNGCPPARGFTGRIRGGTRPVSGPERPEPPG